METVKGEHAASFPVSIPQFVHLGQDKNMWNNFFFSTDSPVCLPILSVMLAVLRRYCNSLYLFSSLCTICQLQYKICTASPTANRDRTRTDKLEQKDRVRVMFTFSLVYHLLSSEGAFCRHGSTCHPTLHRYHTPSSPAHSRNLWCNHVDWRTTIQQVGTSVVAWMLWSLYRRVLFCFVFVDYCHIMYFYSSATFWSKCFVLVEWWVLLVSAQLVSL